MLNRRELIVLVSVLASFFVFASFLSGGVDTDSDNPYLRSDTPTQPDASGVFYGKIEYRDEIHNPSLFEAWVRVHPSDGWPEVELHNNISEASIHTWIQMRGISIPKMNAYRNRPHVEVERERRRYDTAVTFLWNLVHASEYIVLENPKLVTIESPNDLIVVCDVYIEIGGAKVDLAKSLVENGHAMYNDSKPIDWGHRDIREK